MKALGFEHNPGGNVACRLSRDAIRSTSEPSRSQTSKFDPHLAGLLCTSNAGERASQRLPASRPTRATHDPENEK